MARLPYVDPQRAPEHIQAALAQYPPLRLLRMLAHAETAFGPSMRFGGAILSRLQLAPKLRELAILHVARQAEATYEWVQHAEIGRMTGIGDDQIDAIEHGDPLESAAFNDVERSVLAFTSEVLAGPTVSDATFAAVRQTLTPREIVELLLTIGNYLMIARVLTTLDIEIDDAAGDAVVGAAANESRDEASRS